MTTTNTTEVGAVTATEVDELAKLKQQLAAAQAELERRSTATARGLSTMQVIRRTLARKHTATVAEIAAACKAAGVPARSDATIKTIRSDFMQTFAALQAAGRIADAPAKVKKQK